MIENRYQPSAVEGRIYQAWEDAGAFRAGRPERAKAEPYCIVIPPPNVTGSLHMGHALNNTLQDILCRFERMRGKDVLWQPGTDHAGIATQAVVERQLAERKLPSSREMGREAFIARVWEWKAESGGTIISQLKRLGASCDWSRERFTMDEGLSRAVMKVFVTLYREGLIYRDKRLVNWDPKLKTAISDLEVQQVETKGQLWYIKYPIEHHPDEFIVVATTRPETMLGDVAVAVHPNNERLKHLIGRHAILPLVGRRIPIIADDYADPEKGSGAVKITPAHDFNDFEVGRRHDLPLINIFDADAHLDLKDNAAFLENVPASAERDATMALHGLDRIAARKKIVERLEALGLLEKIEPTSHVVPHGDRSGAVLEPFLTDQWYVDAKTLAQDAIAAVRERKTVFVPAQWEATFFNWMENIQPWCVSRQIWWGHQIPAWYGPDGKIFVAETEDDAVADALAHYTEIEEITVEDGHDIAADPDRRARFARAYIKRDEDVLDTWFSSALWPFSTLGWPDQTPELKRYYPTSALVTGFDIIFFWVARMMMMGLHFMKEIPFRDVYIHALVRDASGAKMSKSKGNVIDPLELIDKYGADGLRFTLAAMAAQGRDIKLSEQRVEGYRNFATKLWNAARFAEINGCGRDPEFDPRRAKETLNRWIAHEAAKTGREVTVAIEAYKFNDAAAAIYRFVWNVYCDWYLELIKPVLTGPDGATKSETRAAAAWALDEILKLLHPFMPFVTEELWRVTAENGAKRGHMLVLESWPAHDGLDNAEAEAEIGWMIDLIGAIRSVRAEMNIPPATMLPLVLAGVTLQTAERAKRWSDFVQRLARVGEISFADAAPQGALQLVVRGEVAALPLKGVIDLAAERARLAKEMAKADADIARVDAKLGNANFVARAPEDVVEEEKEKRAEAQARKAKIAEAIDRLKGRHEERIMRIFLAGATGVIGQRLTPLLIAAGHEVVGTTRSADKAAALKGQGAQPVIVDVFKVPALRDAVVAARPEVVIHQLTDLPQVFDPARRAESLERNAKLRIDGTANLVAAAQAAGARRLISQSIAFIYADGPEPHAESDPLASADGDDLNALTARGVRALEDATVHTPGIAGIVLRYGRLYGPGTWFKEPTGRGPLHVDAAAQAALLGVNRGNPGIYNIAEDDGAVTTDKARRDLGFDPGFRIRA